MSHERRVRSSRPQRIAVWGAALGAALALAGADLARAQEPGGTGESILAGSRVFGSQGCAGCHSLNGIGGRTAPDLAESAARRSFWDFGAALWNHLPSMAQQMRARGMSRPRLTPWQVRDLMAFMFWLDYFAPAGDVERGQRLFTEKSCLVCHQVGGVGGVVGPRLDFASRYDSPIQVAAAMWNHSPAMAEALRERGMVRPSFSGSELADLIAYLRSSAPALPEGRSYVLPGEADRGRVLWAERRCGECHSVRGEGGKLGPDLASAEVHRSVIDFAAAMWNKGPVMLSAMRRAGVPVPKVTAGELADLLAFLYAAEYAADAGDPAHGRQLLRDKGCLACHAVSGSGARRAGDLSEAAGLQSDEGVVAALWGHMVLPGELGGEAPAWPKMTRQELADLAASLHLLGRTR